MKEDSFLKSLNKTEGVKAVRRISDSQVRVELFSREITQGLFEIEGDLRSTPQKISSVLKNSSEVKGWKWVEKPRKKYGDSPVETEKVTDRKPKGYSQGHYTVYVNLE